MGLAASQGRLLILTMRQNYVEGRLMSVANEKLSLSRDSSDLSEEYSNSLNARKLVWSTGNSTSSTTDLTYNLLMTPNTTNNAGQYLLADSSGRVILNDTYAKVFDPSGTAASGQVGSVTKIQFLKTEMNLTSDADAQKYIDGHSTPDPVNPQTPTLDEATNFANMQKTVSNLASFVVNPQSATYNNANLEEFTNCLKEFSSEIKYAIQNVTGLTDEQVKTLDMNTLKYSSNGTSTLDQSLTYNATTGDTDNSKTTYGNNSELDYLIRLERSTEAALKLVSLYSLPGNSNQTPTKTITQAITMLLQGGSAASYNTGLINEPAAILASGWDGTYGGDNVAVNSGQTIIPPQVSINFWGQMNIKAPTITIPAGSYLDFDYNGVWKDTKGGAAAFSKDAIFTENINDLFGKFQTVHNKNVAKNPTTPVTPGNTTLTNQDKADFYINLYNQIAAKGWVKNSAIDKNDGKYMQNLLLNGNAFLYQYKNGNWSVVSSSDSDSPLRNVADETASKQAEAKYESEKDKLDYKEKQLDVETNNLDTERSAITTEMESVQKIIDSNIKKFKMFESA